jgi:cell division protein FtsW
MVRLVVLVQALHRQWDRPLALITLALCAVGLVVLFSASARDSLALYDHPWGFWLKQVVFMAVGWGALVFCAQVPTRVWGSPGLLLGGWLTVMVLLLLTMVAGVTANGSERWLSVAGFQFQPSELAKPLGVMLLAWALSQRGSQRPLVVVSLAYALMVGLILKQPNLSITLLLSATYVLLCFMGGLQAAWFSLLVPAMAGAGLYIRNTPYQWRRIQGWLDPFADKLDAGYNLIQSWFAFAQGGLWGVGYGNSVQKLAYLPFHYTDFIFAVAAEEWGLVGSLSIVGLYAYFVWRGWHVALNARTSFGQLLGMGLIAVIGLQAGINLAVATGLFPVTGVTLPLMSYGGTSAVVTLAMVGILLSLSREANQPLPLYGSFAEDETPAHA